MNVSSRAADERHFLPFANEPLVVAYGASVDSTAMLIGLRDRHIKPDLVLFADTGSEKPETIAYLDVMNDWLRTNDFPPITIIKRRSPIAGDEFLHEECLRKSVLPLLAYGHHSCSLKWKVDPQWAYMKKYFGWNARSRSWPHGPTITKLIGYDAGPADSRRMAKAKNLWPPGHRFRYPLVEWGWRRADCEDVILAEGLPRPMKSACFMYPASKSRVCENLSEAPALESRSSPSQASWRVSCFVPIRFDARIML